MVRGSRSSGLIGCPTNHGRDDCGDREEGTGDRCTFLALLSWASPQCVGDNSHGPERDENDSARAIPLTNAISYPIPHKADGIYVLVFRGFLVGLVAASWVWLQLFCLCKARTGPTELAP